MPGEGWVAGTPRHGEPYAFAMSIRKSHYAWLQNAAEPWRSSSAALSRSGAR